VTGSDIADEPARIFLQQDQLRLTATMTNGDTNAAVTMSVYVIMTDKP